jgi:hypothetical protein
MTIWDNIRYSVNVSKPAWILDRKKFCEGMPDLAILQRAIDEKVGGNSMDHTSNNGKKTLS